jgi:hypothetical protein
MKTSPTGIYVPSNLLPSIWLVNFWLVDANTPVLSPLLTTNVRNLKPSIVKIEPKLEVANETADENLSAAAALVIMDPYEVEALTLVTRFGAFYLVFWKSFVFSCFFGYSYLSVVPVHAHIILT